MDEPVRITYGPDASLEIALFGDIDFTNATEVRETIREGFADTRPKVVRVDLGAAGFLDSSGIAVLVVAARLANRVGAEYQVEQANPTVYEHLRLTGLAELFGVDPPPPAGEPGHRTDPPASAP